MKRFSLVTFTTVVLSCLSACSHYVQSTSGSDYLRANPSPASDPNHDKNNQEIDSLVREAAAIEPRLRFPARIGIARIKHGSITNIPQQEAEVWKDLQFKIKGSYGELIPMNPMITALATGRFSNNHCHRTQNTVNQIRLAAATQHLDAVLIYEFSKHGDEISNALSITNLTIVGGFLLPTTEVSSETSAHAFLIDVIEGYPYGTVHVKAEDEMLASTWGSTKSKNKMREKVNGEAISKLGEEVYEMMRDLRMSLMEKRTSELRELSSARRSSKRISM